MKWTAHAHAAVCGLRVIAWGSKGGGVQHRHSLVAGSSHLKAVGLDVLPDALDYFCTLQVRCAHQGSQLR